MVNHHVSPPFGRCLLICSKHLYAKSKFFEGGHTCAQHLSGVQEKVRQKAEGSEEDFDLVPLVIMQNVAAKKRCRH